MVPGGFTNVIEIGCPETPLAGGGTGVRVCFRTQVRALELDHTGAGEKQCRVLGRNQAGRRRQRVLSLRKKIKPQLSDFMCQHESLPPYFIVVCSRTHSP